MQHRAFCQQFLNSQKGQSKKIEENVMSVKKRYILMSEVTLYEALKKQGGTARLQSTALKKLAGDIASKESNFDKKIKFMISHGLINQAYKDFKAWPKKNLEKNQSMLDKIEELGAVEGS
jgi:hypothetical protein